MDRRKGAGLGSEVYLDVVGMAAVVEGVQVPVRPKGVWVINRCVFVK